MLAKFLSTLSLRRATAPTTFKYDIELDFYPRSPCGERPTNTNTDAQNFEFLSTLSLRRATPSGPRSLSGAKNFYPRSPCGERHFLAKQGINSIYISIHALLAESDSKSAQNSGALLRI